MERGFYWVAVGLLVLGVNQSLVSRHGDWLNGVGRNSVAHLAQLSHQVRVDLQGRDSALDQVGELPSQALDQLDRLDSIQVDLASRNADLAQRRAEWVQRRIEMANRIESRRAEWMAKGHVRAFVVCPQQNIRVNVPPMNVPALHVTVPADDGTI
jgi:hypothetical protein